MRFAVRKKALEEALEAYRAANQREPERLGDLGPFVSESSRQIASQAERDAAAGSGELRALLSEDFPFYYDAANRRVASRRSEKELNLASLGLHWNEPRKKKGK